MSALTEPVHRAIATRLRRGQSAEQLCSVGRRTEWWTDDDVDWVVEGGSGPRPDGWTLEQQAPPSPSGWEYRGREYVETTIAPAEKPETPQRASAVEPPAAAATETTPAPAPVSPPAPETAPAPAPAPARVTVDVGEVMATDGVYTTALPAIELFRDETYQRPLDHGRVHRMAQSYDPKLLGVIDVADRGEQPGDEARYAIVAGQHRWAAAVEARGGDVWLACLVHEGLDVAGEAALMHELDRTQKKLSGHDQWRARRAAGDIAVLAVEEIAARHGLRVDSALADGVLRSYGAAEKLWGAGTLDAALGVLVAAYGTAAAGTQAPLLTAVGRLLQLHPDLDAERLIRALAGARPEQLRATATALREVETGPLHELMARAVASAYNRTAGRGGRISGGRS